MRKAENAGNQHSLLFPLCFLPFPKQITNFQPNLICLLQMLSILDQSKILLFGKALLNHLKEGLCIQFQNSITRYPLNPFPNKLWFLHVCSTSLLKTLWEKEKLLVTSNFSFSHSVFSPFRELSAIFSKSEIVVCKLFRIGRV